jgi:hypothetical protein
MQEWNIKRYDCGILIIKWFRNISVLIFVALSYLKELNKINIALVIMQLTNLITFLDFENRRSNQMYTPIQKSNFVF